MQQMLSIQKKTEKHLENIKKLGKDDLPPIMAKTQISFTDDKNNWEHLIILHCMSKMFH